MLLLAFNNLNNNALTIAYLAGRTQNNEIAIAHDRTTPLVVQVPTYITNVPGYYTRGAYLRVSTLPRMGSSTVTVMFSTISMNLRKYEYGTCMV